MLYLFGEEADQFDLDAVEFLDKELASIRPDSQTSQRITDKLVRLKRNDGQEFWVLLYMEVQGKKDVHFDERMFSMYYRIKDKYGQRVVAYAILTDRSEHFRPGRYEEEKLLGTSLVYNYPTLKLKDYQPEDLLKGNNPFGMMLQTAWYHLYGSKDDQQKLESKLTIARRLFNAGLSVEDTRVLYNFIKYYTAFKDNLNYSIFDERMVEEFTTEETDNMELRDHILWAVKEEGKDDGREEGRVEGREEGREEGRVEGREEGRVEGREEGRVEGRAEGTVAGLNKSRLVAKALRAGQAPATIAKEVELPLQAVLDLKEAMGL